MKKHHRKISVSSKKNSSLKSTTVIAGEISLGILLCVTSLLIFFIFTRETLQNEFLRIDLWFSHLLISARTPWLTHVMLFITSLGAQLTFVIAGLLSILLLLKNHKKEAMLFSLALIVGILITTSLKYEILRPRPEFTPLVLENSSSFPSGHSGNAFVFFSLLSFFSYHFFRNRKLTFQISFFSIICIMLVGISRIYLGVHYLTDVIAGYIVGFWWFILVLVIDRTFIFFRIFAKSE